MNESAPTASEASPPAAEDSVRLATASIPRWAIIGIFFLLFISAMAEARTFAMPVVLAILLKLVFSPVQRALDRAGLPSGISALLIVGVLLLSFVAGVAALATPASDWVARAPSIGRELQIKLGEIQWATEGMREAAAQMDEITSGEEDPEVQRVVVDDSGDFVTMAMTVPQVLAQLFFTLILLFFLLSSGDMFYEKLVHVLPTFRDKRVAMRIAHDIERKLSYYLSTITLINACLGVAVGLTMWGLGMPNPALLGVLAFALNFIPYIGAIAGVFLATIVGMVTLPQLYDAVIVGFIYFLLTAVEGQLVTPYFVGRRLRLNTVVVFVFITFCAWLWSVVGMLVATPLLLTLRALCEHIPALEPVGDFLSARGAERETAGEAQPSGEG
jgi:predicted PurR-regulated permease PerM